MSTKKNKKNKVPATGSDNHGKKITEDYYRIASLCRQAFCTIVPDGNGGQIRLASLRLLLAILRVDHYGAVYDTLLRRSSDEAVPKEFQGMKAGRPTKEFLQQVQLINPKLVAAMKQQRISPQKWCQLYDAYENPDSDVDHRAKISDGLRVLRYPNQYFDMSGLSVLELLEEDFPDVFEVDVHQVEYKAASVNPGEKYDTFFSKNGKRFIHVYESDTVGIRVVHKRQSEALRHFNWCISRKVIEERLQILLETKDPKVALKWAPEKKDNAPSEKKENKRKDAPIETEMKFLRLVDKERKRLTDNIKGLEKKRSNLRSDDRHVADKRDQYDIDLQKLRRELDSFLKEYS